MASGVKEKLKNLILKKTPVLETPKTTLLDSPKRR